MLNRTIKSIAAAAILATGAALSVTTSANAGGNFHLQIGGGHGHIYFGEPYYDGPRYAPPRRHYGHRHRACGPKRALNKAWRMGLNRPYVARVNNKRIVVRGFNYGHNAKVVFKRGSKNCRVLKTRGI